MKTKRYIVATIGILLFSSLYAQNKEVKRMEIIKSLNLFFDNLSYVNDEYDPMPASYFAERFGNENVLTGGGNYFRYNGRETSLSSFVQSYAQTSLEGKNINHKLDILNISDNVNPINEHSSSDQRWRVNGELIRSNAYFEEDDKEEDYLIKPVPIELIIRYNGEGRDVSILEINIENPRIQKIYPRYRKEIVFKPTRNNINTTLSADGDQWYCEIQSFSKRTKHYPGTDKISETTSSLEFTFEHSEERAFKDIKIEEMANGQRRISGTLPPNYSKESRFYALKLTQKNTNKEYVLNIAQNGNTFFWRIDNYWGLLQVNLSYSLKYGIGFAYKYHFADTRFTLGGRISVNFDSFRGNIADFQYTSIIGGSSTPIDFNEDLYEIESETVKPNTSNYSSLLDPKNEAEKYTARSLFLVQPGIDITNWFNFTLGAGVALSRNKYFLETAYGYTKYSYKKLDPSLPDIDDVYVYKAYYKDYYYEDKMKCHFAIRPAMDFRIPLGNDNYFNLEVGYVLTPAYKDGNSVDFSVGYTFEY